MTDVQKVFKGFFLVFFVVFMGAYERISWAQDAPSDTPPQISETVSKTEENRQLFTWDRPSAFGKVPAELQAIGDFICAKGRIDLQATGFHPRAKDKDDHEIPGGGYFCEKKSSGDQPHAVAPRLASVNGILGWDRPAAFGRVPEALVAQGRRTCLAMGPALEAIGFHPDALDEKGQKIRGGGFLCGPMPKS